MPSNNTENIYSTEYGGSGSPIPAEKISYDNTESGLQATKVQGAIDELAGSVDVLESDVNNLEHVQLISANVYNVTIPANTVLSDAITLLYDNFLNNIIANLSDDEAVIPRNMSIPVDASGNTLANPLTHVLWRNTETTDINNEVSMMRSYEGATSITIYAGMQGGSTYTHKSLKKVVIASDGTVTMTDLNNITITNERTLAVRYFKCKIIPTS